MHELCCLKNIQLKKKDAFTPNDNAKENFTPISYKTVKKKEVDKTVCRVVQAKFQPKWYGTVQFGAILAFPLSKQKEVNVLNTLAPLKKPLDVIRDSTSMELNTTACWTNKNIKLLEKYNSYNNK